MNDIQEESGLIKLPSRAYSPFKRKLRLCYNSHQNLLLAEAKIIAHWLKSQKGHRNLEDIIWQNNNFNQFCELDQWTIIKSIFRDGKAYIPGVSHFPLALAGETEFNQAGWKITLNDSSKSFLWQTKYVKAHNSPVVKTIFMTLNNLEWVRGSGGICQTIDVTGNRSITFAFGPIGQDAKNISAEIYLTFE